jgi:hypothetical protein
VRSTRTEKADTISSQLQLDKADGIAAFAAVERDQNRAIS